MNANLGYTFYTDLYTIGIGIVPNAHKIADLLAAKLDKKPDKIGNFHFELYTTYPGLAIGVGLPHGVKGDENDFKIGFSFDHTTGFPVIPGSSVKGLLRSVFPCLEKNESLKQVKSHWIQALLNGLKQDTDFLQKTYQPLDSITDAQSTAILKLEKELFGLHNEENVSIYKRDIFHDATMSSVGKKFLDTDYITPHSNPLKNPKPIKFLKIRSEIEFTFQFDLKAGTLTIAEKGLLCQKILLTLGIGAKTNVGYGQLSLTAKPIEKTVSDSKKGNNPPPPPKPTLFKNKMVAAKNDALQGVIFDIDENKIFVRIAFEDGSVVEKNMMVANHKYKENAQITVKVNKIKDDGSFTIAK